MLDYGPMEPKDNALPGMIFYWEDYPYSAATHDNVSIDIAVKCNVRLTD